MTILEHIAHQSRKWRRAFQPTNSLEFFALRLAVHLDDVVAASHYAELASEHSIGILLTTFRQTAESSSTATRARTFHRLLPDMANRTHHLPPPRRLLAIRIERRTVATALMYGDQIEREAVRHLSSNPNKAAESTAAFIAGLVERFGVDSAAIEQVPDIAEVQRLHLLRLITATLQNHAVAIWPVSRRELLAAFGDPPPKSRRELRAMMERIFPWLNGGSGSALVRDAAALGLYCQTERYFIN